MKKLNSIQFYGMPLPIYAFFAIIVLACAYFNIIPNQMIGAVAVLFAFGILIGEIGERLPIWNKFLGGGAMLCFLAAGLLKYFNLLPECVTNVSDGWINGYSFLNVFITFLVVGSLLGIDRDVLIKSGSLYIPTLLCSLLGACVFGVVAGLIFGNDPLYLITSYVLPIMGGRRGRRCRAYGSGLLRRHRSGLRRLPELLHGHPRSGQYRRHPDGCRHGPHWPRFP